jgi:hypothetical protein
MPKSWFSTKFQPYPINYMSTASNLGFWSDFHIVKQLYYILLHNCWKFIRALSYPYNLYPQNLDSFHPAIYSQIFFLRFCPVGCCMKEVPFWFIQMVWNLHSVLIWSNNSSHPNFSSIPFDMWVLLHGLYFWPVEYILQQVLFWQVQMVWNFLGIFISSNHWAMPNFSPIGYSMWVALQDL